MRYTDIRSAAPARHDSRSSSRPLNSKAKSRMPSLFNAVRGCIFITAIVFTIICLAMAGHFQQVLAPSDLTRFVPFAIFVCSASLLIITVLLSTSLVLKGRNPISTKIEIVCLGFAGILWLVLGVYLTTSDSQSADVECFASASSTTPLDDADSSFHTDQYHAMYRILMVFALLNAILLLLSFSGLLGLAWKRGKQGDEQAWRGPVTAFPWFASYNKANKAALPPKRNGHKKKTSILPTTNYFTDPKPIRKHSTTAGGTHKRLPVAPPSPPTPSRTPQKEEYPKVYQQYRSKPERQDSGRKPERQDSGRRPERQDSERRPERQDSGRRLPERQASGNRGQQPQRNSPYGQYKQTSRSPPDTSMSYSFEDGVMRNPNRK